MFLRCTRALIPKNPQNSHSNPISPKVSVREFFVESSPIPIIKPQQYQQSPRSLSSGIWTIEEFNLDYFGKIDNHCKSTQAWLE